MSQNQRQKLSYGLVGFPKKSNITAKYSMSCPSIIRSTFHWCGARSKYCSLSVIRSSSVQSLASFPSMFYLLQDKLKSITPQAVVNHEEQITQLAKACTQIAGVLPRVELTLALYKTDKVKRAVNDLYAVIVRFLWHAVKWYRKGKLSHTWTAIVRPWELSLKKHVDNIEEVSRRIDQLASSASKAELRATHIEVHQVRTELENVRLQVDRLVQMAYRKLRFGLSRQLD